MDLSIVIVNYNTRELLMQSLESVALACSSLTAEIFVVDNGSSDGSVDAVKSRYPKVHVLSNLENRGFACANNLAIRKSKGRYILLLNSDTLVHSDTFNVIVDFMDSHKTVGASGCKVIKPDGKLDLACKRSFPTPSNSLYHLLKLDRLFPESRRFGTYNLTYLDEDEVQPVDCLVGAFMMVRKEVISEVGMLDEEFFMYGEDIDWCYRIKQAGWGVWYVPTASIIHYKGASSKKKKNRMIYEFHRSMFIYYRKHYLRGTKSVSSIIILLGIIMSLLAAWLVNLGKRND